MNLLKFIFLKKLFIYPYLIYFTKRLYTDTNTADPFNIYILFKNVQSYFENR